MRIIRQIDWDKHGLPLAFVAMIIVFTVINPAFFSMRNMIQTTRQGAILFLIVSGQTIALLARGIDLSQGSVMGLASVATISSIYVFGAYVGSIVGILFGALCGLVNGILIGYLGIPPILTTLGMLFVALGAELVYTGGVTLTNLTDIDQVRLFWFGGGMIGPIPVPVVFAVIIGLVLYYLLKRTGFGRQVYFVGTNADATHMVGINVKRLIVIVYILSALLASLGAFFLTARLTMGFPHLGEGWLVLAIGGAVLGGTSVLGGKGGIGQALLGAMVIVFLDNGLIVSGVSSFAREAIIGGVIILACLSSVIRGKSK
jgi:ribose/xylose/arabinose/galactoside ABC-type transport system permease subunit